MLRVLDTAPAHTCRGFTRREFLCAGSLALAGLSLPGLLAARARAGEAKQVVKDKAVVLLFLQGGPSHIEFFDPKMTAPAEIRSITGEVQTKLPGITFGGTFTKLAERADRIAIVRSFASGNADHQNYLSVAGAGNALKAPMGSLYARVAGATHPRTGMPTNVLIPPEGVEPGLKLKQNFETQALKALAAAGQLGAAYTPFDPSGGGELRQNLELRIPRDRLDDRKSLLERLDGFKRQMDKTRVMDSLDTFQRQAYEVVLRGVADAFDVTKEDPRTLAKYDTSGIFKNEDLQKWGDMRRTTNLLGKQMLLARRLIEAGCGFVTVTDAGWDMHANGNSPKNMEGMKPMTTQVDHAVAAFLDDLKDRGLSDRVLLLVTGEMGRTPKLNKNGGRDHYANLTPLLVAGGGLKMGQVIGASDRNASNPATEKYTPQHLLATVMETLFEVGEVRIMPDVPTTVAKIMTEGKPIKELM